MRGRGSGIGEGEKSLLDMEEAGVGDCGQSKAYCWRGAKNVCVGRIFSHLVKGSTDVLCDFLFNLKAKACSRFAPPIVDENEDIREVWKESDDEAEASGAEDEGEQRDMEYEYDSGDEAENNNEDNTNNDKNNNDSDDNNIDINSQHGGKHCRKEKTRKIVKKLAW
ncbi:hypothetical protein F5146DRAFT_1005156 [Armillaria mellea]|nr:hypothetical protein F5146DRAFT_1005156 [Armillaria mellea]